MDPKDFIDGVRNGKDAMVRISPGDALFWDAKIGEMSSLDDRFAMTSKATDLVLEWLGNIKSKTAGQSLFIIG